MKYAIVSMPDHLFTAVPVFLCSFALLYFVGGMVWGMMWNKKWSLAYSSTRFLSVGIVSIVAALSLAAADSLQSAGSMFQTKTAAAVRSLTPDDNNEIRVTKEESAYDFLKRVEKSLTSSTSAALDSIDGSDTSEGFDECVLTRGSIDAYSTSILLLWGIFGTCLILLIGGVAMAAYSNIKEIKSIA